ncbi:MAG: hypothetical protein HYV63_23795 [Candidatus Schekmanbacteria bacterium]|nr:hypothetical protein [Candidatus Schekmanbacteria bacterium]
MSVTTSVRDAIHGRIDLSPLERHLVSTRLLHRLRRIRQHPFAGAIYPGSGWSVFDHSLGAAAAAGRLVRHVLESSPTAAVARFAAALYAELDLTRPQTREQTVKELVDAARLHAMCYHLGALPYSTSIGPVLAEGAAAGNADHLPLDPAVAARFHHLPATADYRDLLRLNSAAIVARGPEISDVLRECPRLRALVEGALTVAEGETRPALSVFTEFVEGPLGALALDSVWRDGGSIGASQCRPDVTDLTGAMHLRSAAANAFELVVDGSSLDVLETFVLDAYRIQRQLYQDPSVLARAAMLAAIAGALFAPHSELAAANRCRPGACVDLSRLNPLTPPPGAADDEESMRLGLIQLHDQLGRHSQARAAAPDGDGLTGDVAAELLENLFFRTWIPGWLWRDYREYRELDPVLGSHLRAVLGAVDTERPPVRETLLPIPDASSLLILNRIAETLLRGVGQSDLQCYMLKKESRFRDGAFVVTSGANYPAFWTRCPWRRERGQSLAEMIVVEESWGNVYRLSDKLSALAHLPASVEPAVLPWAVLVSRSSAAAAAGKTEAESAEAQCFFAERLVSWVCARTGRQGTAALEEWLAPPASHPAQPEEAH